MTVEEIKTQIALLAEAQQDHLAAFLVSLRRQRDTGARQEIARRIDDKQPENWLTVDELKEKWNG
jgi:hypothetical protein